MPVRRAHKKNEIHAKRSTGSRAVKRKAKRAGVAKTPATATAFAPAVRVLNGSAAAARRLYVLSDSTGNLPRHLINALLTQFPAGTFQLEFRNFVETPVALRAVLADIGRAPGAVFHAFLSPEMKVLVQQSCPGNSVDLTGPFVQFLANLSGVTPATDARKLHPVDRAYHDRIAALEFTLTHDDGLGLDTLDRAEVVLVGVSRTSKSPTSMYLAQMGIKAANVALAPGVAPPRELLALPPGRVVGLYVEPERLAEVRAGRQAEWNLAPTAYNDLEAMREELEWSRRLFRAQGWPTLNVSHLAIEETAGRVLHLLGRTPPTANG